MMKFTMRCACSFVFLPWLTITSDRGSSLLQTRTVRQRTTIGLDDDEVKEQEGLSSVEKHQLEIVEKVLKEEDEVEKDEVQETGNNIISAHETLKDLDASLESNRREEIRNVLQKDRKSVLKAFEDFSNRNSPETAQKNGDVITRDTMNTIYGLKDTPEHGPDRFQDDQVPYNDSQAILLQKNYKNGLLWGGTLWSKTDTSNWDSSLDDKIPYCFANDIHPDARQGWIDAAAHYNNLVECVQFKEVPVAGKGKCVYEPAVYVKSDEAGCWSNVGMPYCWERGHCGESRVNLEPVGCTSMGIAAHEMGHALGMGHEQARTDVTDHLIIMWDNIRSDEMHNYKLEEGNDRSVPYDLLSLMHYGATDFGKPDSNGNPKHTMKLKDDTGPIDDTVMGNRMGLTNNDAIQVARMYGCEAEHVNFKLCTVDPDDCTVGACRCHQDPANKDGVLKVSARNAQGQTCHRCLERCPNYPTGVPKPCGCPDGMTFDDSFTQNGKRYRTCMGK